MSDEEVERLLELCMYALLPKRIYNHKIDNLNKGKFKNIIRENLNEDTWTIREKIERCWDNK